VRRCGSITGAAVEEVCALRKRSPAASAPLIARTSNLYLGWRLKGSLFLTVKNPFANEALERVSVIFAIVMSDAAKKLMPLA
jgi:hypothetical protein